MAAAKGDQPCTKFSAGATIWDRKTLDCNCKECNNCCPSSCTSPWFGVLASASGVSGMVGSGTHLYQGRMFSAILEDFTGCIKRKYGLVQPSLEKEEYEFVAAIWYLQQVTLEERYSFLSHFRHPSKALGTAKILAGTIINIQLMKIRSL